MARNSLQHHSPGNGGKDGVRGERGMDGWMEGYSWRGMNEWLVCVCWTWAVLHNPSLARSIPVLWERKRVWVQSELVLLSKKPHTHTHTHFQHIMLTRSTHPEPDLERKRIQRWPDWQNRPTEAHNPWHPASEMRRGQLEKRKKSGAERKIVSGNECSEQHMLVPQKPRTSRKPMKHRAYSIERKTERERDVQLSLFDCFKRCHQENRQSL